MTLEVTAKTRLGEFWLELSFVAPPGITVLSGPSGSGKTSTLRVVAGLLRGGGRVVVDGDVYEGPGVFAPPEARRVGLVFQSLALFPHLTAKDNVGFGAADEGGASRWLERLGVGHLKDRKPGSFSGGEAQRVALARALARRPRVLLLDEPFTSLHASLRAELQAEVQGVVRELGIPALMVTHDALEAARLADQTIIIEHGRRLEPAPVA